MSGSLAKKKAQCEENSFRVWMLYEHFIDNRMMAADREKLGLQLCCIVERMKCSKESIAAFEGLLMDGADIDFKSPYDDDNTPLHIAIKRQDVDWIRHLIIADASLNVKNRLGLSAHDAAAETRKY